MFAETINWGPEIMTVKLTSLTYSKPCYTTHANGWNIVLGVQLYII